MSRCSRGAERRFVTQRHGAPRRNAGLHAAYCVHRVDRWQAASRSNDASMTTNQKYSSVTPITGRLPSDAQRNVEERFATLEGMVAKLKDTILATQERIPLSGKVANVQAVKDLVTQSGCATVATVKRELGVSAKTANRLLHAVMHGGFGKLIFEPAGTTDRLVLFHNDRVEIDDPRQ